MLRWERRVRWRDVVCACRMHARIDRSLLRRQEAIGDDDDTKLIRNEMIQKFTARQESFEAKQ